MAFFTDESNLSESHSHLLESTRNQTEVALNITKQLFSKQDNYNKNIVFSPLSIQVMLSIIAAGSSDDTLEQVLSFLRFKSKKDLISFVSKLFTDVLIDGSQLGGEHICCPNLCVIPCTLAFLLRMLAQLEGPHLCFAYGAWVDQSVTLKPSFENIIHTYYKAAFVSVDFQNKADEARDEINTWVKKETNELNEELIPPGSISSLTRLIFANALYFKGTWESKFDASRTKDYDFHLLNGTSVKVPFMTMTNHSEHFVNAFGGFKILGLPYEQGRDTHSWFFMYLILPDAKDGLSALVEQVCSKPGFLERILPHEKVEVGEFRIPRFKTTFGFDAKNVLKELGLVLPFHGGLTEMADSPGDRTLRVSKITQKSFIEVNEEGTEAAVTEYDDIVAFGLFDCIPTKINFVADHPFLFVIRDDISESRLFVEQVLDPLAG